MGRNNYIIDKENGIAKIELHRRNEENLYAIIDLEDLERVINYPYTWFAQYRKELEDYYVRCTNYANVKNGISSAVFLHQFIMNADGQDVDHINNKPLDNRKSNLRISEHKHNTKNRHGKNRNNTSGHRNVSWSKSENRWLVQLQIDGKNKILGRFAYDKLDEAGKFAEEMRNKCYGEYAGKN
jgi:hypothetical protein